MLKTGAEHLQSLRDGRVVYIGRERVEDVTTHPAFRNAAHTIAAIYDAKHGDPAMSFEADGARHSAWFLQSRSRADLEIRSNAHRRVADMTWGMFGRSPDHVASFVTGMAMNPAAFGTYAANVPAYYKHMRDHDTYAAYAVIPPQASRNPEFYQRMNMTVPTLQVVGEDDQGVIISGMKMLATGAILANEIWVGNLIPLAAEHKAQAITCAIPCNAPGLSLWSRKPIERDAQIEFENPLGHRFDETDSMLIAENVKVPWERVFVHNDALLSREIYITTPAHCFGNHQSNVRYAAKLRLIVGMASKVAKASGADSVPAVRETLGRLASMEALLSGVIAGQIQAAESWPAEFCVFNRRMMYAALNWCTESYTAIIDTLRELCGGGVFQMPADISVTADPALNTMFETFWATPQMGATDRMKLFKLAWDLVGSEFAGRHQSYEKFYAGASFIVRGHCYREAPWAEYHDVVDRLMAGYDVPELYREMARAAE